ncbi:MAG: DUF1499 domain-containing protein [Actinomycetota bacterium]
MNRLTRTLVGLVLLAVAVVLIGRLVSVVAPSPVLGLTEEERLHPCEEGDDCVSSATAEGPGAIDPLPCGPGKLEQVAEHAELVLDRTELQTRGDTYAHLTSRSQILGLVDDLELHADGGAVQVRSAARVSLGDRGVNAERVEQLREEVADTICQ